VLDPALSNIVRALCYTRLLRQRTARLSALVLSLIDAQANADGFLRANDIYNLKLPAELVVLSAARPDSAKTSKAKAWWDLRAALCTQARRESSSVCGM